MTDTVVRVEDALTPVRDALTATARADAARRLAAAHQEAATILARARADARQTLDDARARGEHDAASLAAATQAQARRHARTLVLRARRRVHAELRRRVRQAVTALREDASYPALLDELTARARATLGADAEILEVPSGGVVATVPGRRFVCTLADLTADALAEEELALAEQWAS